MKKKAAKPKAKKKRHNPWHPFKNKENFLRAEALESGRRIAQIIAEDNPGVPVHLKVYL
jgi:hypothetical protein